ncbi:transglutaminase domain-containing protein [uncultured Jatrophihabitans sp.]|uniref:transglutaminase family protein n=1 Tax=uncultured Jatrophihabitans sp. TaxID=1610747 RepID=UPI0035CAB6DE
MTFVRRVLPLTILPLAMLATGLASVPWLRSFPSSVIAVPLFGAAALSVLLPVVSYGIGVRRLWLTMLIDVALFVFYELTVVLRDPGGFSDLYDGLVHGPAQLLSFALPLVSPRSLLVAPIALCWASGGVLGECVARGWRTVLPYFGLLVALALSYAATTRAITAGTVSRRSDTLIAVSLLLVLLLLRAVGAWIAQEASATAGSADNLLPIRSVGVGVVLAVLVAAFAGALVRAPAFSGPPTGAARQPSINHASSLTPLSFVAGLRPSSPTSRGRELFRMTTDRASSNYVALASVDRYDGDGWSFQRTFRPSGGVLPADTDTELNPGDADVDQSYRIDAGPMSGSAWVPSLYRARRVSGVGVDVDPASGMIVPDQPLHAGQTYGVESASSALPFDELKASATVTDYAPANLALPPNPTLTQALATLVSSLETETGTHSVPGIAFLQAVARDFRTRSALATNVPAPTPSPSPLPSPSPTTTQVGAPAAQAAGGTGFADVLASIRQFRSATPEQFATLMCLVARQINIPARVVTGFRVPLPHNASELPAGTYRVTSAQAWTWVEVPVAGQGWVVLDPSPTTHAAQRAQSSAAAAPSPTATPTPSRSALITHGADNSGHRVAPPSTVPYRTPVPTHTVVIVVIVVLALLVLALIAFLALRKGARRRRRRGAADPRRRLLGAWQESLDLLEEAGLPDLTHENSREITRAAQERFGGESAAQVRLLGNAANRAIFNPSHPVAAEDADAAWQAQQALRQAVHDRLDWQSRLRSGLHYRRRRATDKRRRPISTRARH